MNTWVEKYRPNSLDDIVSQTKTISHLKDLLRKKEIPHLIFTGSPGNGKTSTAIAFVKDFFKINYPNTQLNSKWIFIKNASDELRASKGDLDNIKSFVYSESLSEKNGFKFIILEESDRMSKVIQGGLRRIMELAPPNVRFIFTNNYVENLIDPIISRCGIYRFYPIPKKDSIDLVKSIIKKEGVYFKEKDISIVYTFSRGDLRKLINNLQIISKVKKDANINLYDFFGIYTDKEMYTIISLLKDGNFEKLMKMTYKHISPQNVIFQLFDYFLHKYNGNYLDDIILCIENFDKRFISRSDEKLQMRAFFSSLSLIMRGERVD